MIALGKCENRSEKLQTQNQYLDSTISPKIAKAVHTCTQVNYETGLRM